MLDLPMLGAAAVNSFYIGKAEVTWGEWKKVRTWAVSNGYTDLANVGQGLGDNYPVTHVNWYDAVKWCNARSEMEGKTPVYSILNYVPTSGTTNFAVHGEGFFQVMLPDGSFGYTRDGAFKQDQNGRIVTGDGYPVQGFAPVPLGATSSNVNAEGFGEHTGPRLSPVQFQVDLVRFADPINLSVFGKNLYGETVWSGSAQFYTPGSRAMGTILQGYLETNEKPLFKTGELIPHLNPQSNGYRLPVEAEWEFAARGGTQTRGYIYSGSNNLSAVGWYNENSGSAVHEVGKKLANELGIYDMSGNLWEWSGSWYPGSEGSNRVIRGGNWYGIAGNCGVDNRVYLNSEYRSSYNGFRVALSSVP